MNVIWKELLNKAQQNKLDLRPFYDKTLTAVMPLPNYSLIKIAGVDAEKFLQGQTTNDISLLKEEEWQLSCCCNQKGRIIAILRILKHNAAYFIITESSVAAFFLSELNKYKVFSKITLELDANHFILGVSGDLISQFNKDATLVFNYPANLKQAIVVYNADNLAELPSNLPFASSSAWLFLNINNGIPEIHKVTQEKFTPHQLNLPELNAVNFKKGCYRGQEIVARMHYLGKLKQRLYKIMIQSSTELSCGDPVIDSNQSQIGEIINCVKLDKNHYFGLAVLNSAQLDGMISLKEDGLLEVLS